eukprot:GHVN01106385.1.p1 GENE.GHVN01106385.1~~GHVN01106385.1.p1  ORF type:complete len:198 (+),score=29.08 GHVN01106385.1:444-1037(+)
MVDHYSRYCVLLPCEGQKSDEAKQGVGDAWVGYFGAPRAVLCDRGPAFIDEGFRNFITQEIGAQLILTSSYYPQGNGINESSHRLVEHVMKTSESWTKGVEESSLNEVLTEAMLIHNNLPHKGTGETPAYLTFGQDGVLPQWQDFTPRAGEQERRQTLIASRRWRLMKQQLKETIKESERKYEPEWSFPHRVKEVRE